MHVVGPCWSTGRHASTDRRQLTGRVTKWLVARGLLDHRRRRGLGLLGQAHRRPEQRGVLVAARVGASRPRPWRSCPTPSTPTTSRPWWSTSGRPGSPRTTSPRSRTQAAEIAKIDGVTTGRASLAAAESAAAQGRRSELVSEDGEVAYLYLVLNFGKNGWNDMPDAADQIRDIAALDGGHGATSPAGGQAADSAEAFAGIDGKLLFTTLRRRDRDPAAHLPQPGAVAAARSSRAGVALTSPRRP